MAHENQGEDLIRRYLLGQLAEDEREHVEEKMMADNEFFNAVLLAEDEMIEEYVQGELSESDREGFEASFLSTPEGRQQVAYAKALGKFVKDVSPSSETDVRIDEKTPTIERPAKMGERQPTEVPVVEGPLLDNKVKPSVWWRRPAIVPYLRLAAAAIVVLSVGLGTWRVFFYQSEVRKGKSALVEAYGRQRPLESRISGFKYAPAAAQTRGDQDALDTVSHDLAAELLMGAVTKHPDAESHHALGQFYLADREFDKAITQFEEALKTEPNNAQLHSDLGAALLEKGKAAQALGPDRGAQELSQSLEHLNRALDLADSLLEARFNLGLAREALGLSGQAEDAWKKYLEKDPQGPWAGEARRRLEQLVERQRRSEQGPQDVIEVILNAYQQRDGEKAWALLASSREKTTSQLLAAHLAGISDRSANADRTPIEALAYSGELDIRKAGDHYAFDLAAFYKSASQRQLASATAARDLLRQAQKSYQQAALDETFRLYTQAQQALSAVGDKCEEQLAICGIALTLMEMARTEQSATLFGALARDCEGKGYRWLRARALFYQSAIEFARNEYSKAIASAKLARAEAGTVNDQSCFVSAVDALVEYYRVLANRNECFSEISLSLPGIERSSLGSIALGRHYGIIALALNTFGLHNAATDCQQEALRFALMIPEDFASLSVAYAHLGLMYGKLRKLEDAFKTLDMAYAQAEAHAGERAGQEKMAYAALQIGNLRRDTGDYVNALSSYDRSIELYASLHYPTFLYQAYKGRLVCFVAQNDVEATRRQFTDVMALMDKHRTNIFEEENRNNFFDVEQSVYDLGIDFEYSRMGKARKAFEYAESSRGRSLLDSTGRAATAEKKSKAPLPVAQPFTIEQIQARLPAAARLLQYAVLEDTVVIWILSRSGFDSTVVNCSQTSLTEMVSNYLSALKSSTVEDETAASEFGRELYAKLIAPVEPYLGGSKSLYIVPDKVLNRLPWDALISNDRFLVEDYMVTVSPSATLFAVCTDLADQKGGSREERILSVGNPSFDQHEFPRLGGLSDAAREATDVAEMYPSMSRARLIGREAREQTVRDELLKADVAHFAMHCVIDERSPAHSCLVLAKELGDSPPLGADGVLQAQEICEMSLPRTRLVVLSACQTGVERYYRGEGMMGMARAFFVARVPVVVASLWRVDSRATAELMVRFHRYRKDEGRPVSEALSLAKQALLHTGDQRYGRPYFWAAFQTIGGHTSF